MSISSAPSACPSCFFGATSTSILSFTLHKVETITVSKIPHVTVYVNNNGSTSITSWQNTTETATDFVGSQAGSNGTAAPKTFTDKKDITWTYGDATLTYPTTYVQYLGFEGAAATSDDGETCAALSDTSSIELPSSTSCAPFIYPVEGNATNFMALPTPLLDYLAQLPEVAAQFNGDALTGCAPLTWTPPANASAEPTASSYVNGSSSSAPSPSPYSSSPFPLGTGSAPVPQTTLPSSSVPVYSEPSQSSSSRPGNHSYVSPPIRPTKSLTTSSTKKSFTPTDYGGGSTPHASSAVLSTTTDYPPPPPPPATSPNPVNPHNPLPGPETESTLPISSAAGYSSFVSSAEPPAYTTAYSSDNTLTHTTAFVIEPITGPTTYTTISGPAPDHTKHHGGGKGPGGYTPKTDHTTDHNGGSPDGTGHHTGDNTGPTPKPQPGNPQPEKPHHTGHEGQTPHHYPDGPDHTGGSEHVSPAGNGHKPKPTPQKYTHDGHTVTAKTGGAVVIGSKTVRPGHQVTIGKGTSKTAVALQTKGGRTHLVVGGSTYDAVPDHAGVTPAPQKPHVSVGVITTDGHTITAIRSGKLIVLAEGSSTTKVRAGDEATFGGQTISVPHRGGSVVVNGNGVHLTGGDDSTAVVTAGGHKFTAVDAGNSIILEDGSSTIVVKDGSRTVFHGQTVSVPAHGSAVVVNGKMTTLAAATGSVATGSAIITADSHTITALGKDGSVVFKEGASTITVKDGGATTFAGQKVSVLRNGSAVVVNGATTSSFTAKPTTTGVGGYVRNGLGGGTGKPTPSATVTPATGSASSVRSVGALCGLLLGIAGLVVMI